MEELKQHMEQKLQEEMDRTKACQAKAATFERAIFDLRAQLDMSHSSTQLKETLNLKDQLEIKLADKERYILESQDKINELQASIFVLEDKLAHSPTQEQLEELTSTMSHLEAKLAQEKILKDKSLEKVISLQDSVIDLQHKLDSTSTKYHEAEQMCASLTKKLDAALGSVSESQTRVAAFEHTILDLETKLADAQTSNQLQEAVKANYDSELQMKYESQSAKELQSKVDSQDNTISMLEAKLTSIKSQLDEMSANKEALEVSFAAESLLVKEKQEHIRALQASLDTTPTLAQVQALEEAKVILTKELAMVTENSQEKILLLESEIIALKQELALVRYFSQNSPLDPVMENASAMSCTEAESKSAHDESVSFSHIEAELNECRGQLENAQKEMVVARQLIKTLKASSNIMTQDPNCDNHKQTKQYWDAREKELLFTIASLASELEDYKYPVSSENKQLQATCDAAIAHSKKLAYELSEAKHSSAHKISALNAEKKLLRQELLAQETLNFELMRELEEQKICQPPEY
ncbi:hypothetical protein DSO57_1001384 [Entomophthora muscae]|uniref:Uncharacterized protein n=1 Tax=Entomophthora muscae TaxID=34485 RepID=A0ACC2SYV0_9FUNG|nr:hypothetical protein DSO57_1001384 [Entomophthora muscae]